MRMSHLAEKPTHRSYLFGVTVGSTFVSRNSPAACSGGTGLM
jgi:hypothetical protein